MGAVLVTWWLIHSTGMDRPPSELLFENRPDRPVPLGAQIQRWLRIADLNFRGAYPWLLLAPYVLWLSSKFLIERDSLRLNLPVHLLACVLFVAGSRTLTSQTMEKRKLVVVVSEHHEKSTTAEPPTNGSILGAEQSSGADYVNVHTYTSHRGDGRTKIVVTSDPAKSEPPGLSAFARQIGLSNAAPTQDVLRRFGLPKEPEDFAGNRNGQFFSSVRYESHLFAGMLNILAYASLAGIGHAVHFYRRSRERDRRAVLLESHLAKARLHALQTQLQPHFLFNALNAVATLLRRDPKAAQEALTSFSELLRLALSQSDKQEVSLREDLLFVERYMEIQQTRLGERLRFEQSIDPATLDCLVPTLFLQPLVENAIRHGIEPTSAPGLVRIRVTPAAGRLRFIVEDNGVGLPPEEHLKTGIGLSNLRSRLEALYGSEQQVEVDARSEGGVAVRIEIPLRRTLGTTDVDA